LTPCPQAAQKRRKRGKNAAKKKRRNECGAFSKGESGNADQIQ